MPDKIKTQLGSRREASRWQRVIIGIDPGTNIMGYALLGITADTPPKPEMIAMGVVRFSKYETHYLRLSRIHQRVTSIIEEFLPDEMAIEAPFFGKNIQTTLKLGRAQGAAMVAALAHDIPITEYEPSRIKLTVAGIGSASKEQVRDMLRRELHLELSPEMPELDASDALGVALCHYHESLKPEARARAAIARASTSTLAAARPSSWKEFLLRHPDRIK